jgi:hypothetical protein
MDREKISQSLRDDRYYDRRKNLKEVYPDLIVSPGKGQCYFDTLAILSYLKHEQKVDSSNLYFVHVDCRRKIDTPRGPERETSFQPSSRGATEEAVYGYSSGFMPKVWGFHVFPRVITPDGGDYIFDHATKPHLWGASLGEWADQMINDYNKEQRNMRAIVAPVSLIRPYVNCVKDRQGFIAGLIEEATGYDTYRWLQVQVAKYRVLHPFDRNVGGVDINP